MAIWSVVPFSGLTQAIRLDAHYYEPRYLALDTLLSGPKVRDWKSLDGDFIVGPFGSTFTVDKCVDSSPYRYVRGKDVKPFFLLDDDSAYMSGSDFERLSRYQLRPGDLLVSVVGTLGNVAIVTDDVGDAVFSCKSTAYRSRSVDPYYLCAYLNSQVGQSYLARKPRGSVQTGLNLDDLKTVPIYVPSPSQQNEVGDMVRCSRDLRLNSRAFYSEAGMLLLQELGLDRVDLSTETAYTATFAEATAAQRLDAEYFQPKYETLIRHIEATGQAVRLGNWVTEDIHRGVLPDYAEDGRLLVINSQHVGKTHVELEDNRATTWAFAKASRNKRALVGQHDVLLNSTGYITIGRCQTLLDDVKAVVDGHVSVIRPKAELDPVYLGLYLNALPGQMQTERGWTGSSGQIELRPEVISGYTVWKAQEHVQKRIRQLIEDSHKARQEAKQLLEQAKQRVEEMVLEAS